MKTKRMRTPRSPEQRRRTRFVRQRAGWLFVATVLFASTAFSAPSSAQEQSKEDPQVDAAGLAVASANASANQVVANATGGVLSDGSDGIAAYLGENFEMQLDYKATGWVFPDSNKPVSGTSFDVVLQVGPDIYSSRLASLLPVPNTLVQVGANVVEAQVYAELGSNNVYDPGSDHLVRLVATSVPGNSHVDFDITVTRGGGTTTPASAAHSIRIAMDTDRATPAGNVSGDAGKAYGVDEFGARVVSTPVPSDLEKIGVVRYEGSIYEDSMWIGETPGFEFSAWSSGNYGSTWAEARLVAGPTARFNTALHDNGLVAMWDLCFASCPAGSNLNQVLAQVGFERPAPPPQVGVVLAQPCVAFDSSAGGSPFATGELRTADLTGNLSAQGGDAAGCVPPNCAVSVLFSVQAIDPQAAGNLRLSAAGELALGGVVNYAANNLNNANTVTVDVSPGNHQVDIYANGATPGAVSTDVRLLVVGYYVDPASSACAGGTLLEYYPLPPCAVADTRVNASPLPSGSPFQGPVVITAAGNNFGVDVVDPIAPAQLSGFTNPSCGIPSGADVAVVNVVAIGAPSQGGLNVGGGELLSGKPPHVIVPFENTSPRPLTNAAVMYAPIDSNGEISVMPTGLIQDRVHFRVVVLGYLDDASLSGGLKWVSSVAPCAAFDTRFGVGQYGGPRSATGSGTFSTRYAITGNFSPNQGGVTQSTGLPNTTCGVPPVAEAVQLNLVAINAQGPGNMRVNGSTSYAGGVLNFDQITPQMHNSNAVTVPLGAGTGELFVQPNCGTACNFAGLVDVRGVVMGYFVP